jgi:CubicO group peptidase (beta-lactamase class C family)
VGYTYFEPNFDRCTAPEWNLGAAAFSGGLYSTPEDLARFIAFQFLDDSNEKDGILSKDGIRRLRTPQSVPKPNSTESYGLGWGIFRVENYQGIGHSGSHFGFFARVEALPELKIGIAIMTNANYPQGYIGPKKRLTRIILEKLIPVMQIEQPETPFDPSSVDLKRYTGRYEVAGGYAKADVYLENRRLYMTFVQEPDFNEYFLPVGPNRFCFASDPEKNPMLFFDEDEMGNVANLRFLSYVFHKK